MGELTSRELIFMLIVIVFGLAFFAAVCIAIYYYFKRLARLDEAENAHFSEEKNDTENH